MSVRFWQGRPINMINNTTYLAKIQYLHNEEKYALHATIKELLRENSCLRYEAVALNEAKEAAVSLAENRLTDLNWLAENFGTKVHKIGNTWYSRSDYQQPYIRCKTLKQAMSMQRT